MIKTLWVPGAGSFLGKFEYKIPLFAVSGAPQAELEKIVSKRDIKHCFSGVFGSPILKPIHVFNVIKQYHLNRKNCYFIGDAMTDYYTAVDPGLNFIGIQGDNHFPDGAVTLPSCTTFEQHIIYINEG